MRDIEGVQDRGDVDEKHLVREELAWTYPVREFEHQIHTVGASEGRRGTGLTAPAPEAKRNIHRIRHVGFQESFRDKFVRLWVDRLVVQDGPDIGDHDCLRRNEVSAVLVVVRRRAWD